MKDEQEKKKIKLIYKELRGYLSQIPVPQNAHDLFFNKSQWEYINKTIDRLNTATGKNFDEYKTIQEVDSEGWSISVSVTTVRSKVAGLINVLHEEYFSDEQPPFVDSPSVVISQSQSQQQNMTITLLEIQSKIDDRLSQTTDEKEKTFLTKLKEQLPTITSIFQLIQIIFNIAQQSGLDIHAASHTVNTLLA